MLATRGIADRTRGPYGARSRTDPSVTARAVGLSSTPEECETLSNRSSGMERYLEWRLGARLGNVDGLMSGDELINTCGTLCYPV